MNEFDPTTLLEHGLKSPSRGVRDLVLEYEAFRRLRDLDREMALVRARRIVERLARMLYTERIGEVGKRDLSAMLHGLRAGRVVPPGIYAQLMLIREMGNIGAHADDGGALELGSPAEPPLEVGDEELLVCEHALFLALKHVVRLMSDRRIASERRSMEYAFGSQVSHEHVNEVVALARAAYPGDVVLPVGTIESWRQANPEVLHLALDPLTTSVAGYLLALPLTPDAFRRTLLTGFDEKSITSEDVQMYDVPDFYFLYISSIVVDPVYRHSGVAYRTLVDGFFSFLVRLAERDVFILEVTADAVTPQGERMCRSLGMTASVRKASGSVAFHAVLLPPSFRSVTRAGIALHRHYARRYEEFKDVLHLLGDGLAHNTDGEEAGTDY